MTNSQRVARKTLLEIPGCTPELARSLELQGLIPESYRDPHLRGRPSFYPPGTDDLVRALIVIGRVEKLLDHRGFAAWWAGHPVPTPTIRRILKAALDATAVELAELLDEHSGALAVGEALAERFARPQSEERLARRPDVRQWKHNVGDRDDFMLAAIPALALLIYGEQPTWPPPDQERLVEESTKEEVLARLIGVEKAATEKTPDGHTLIPEVPSMQALFTRLQEGGLTDMERLSETLETASDSELSEARNIARSLVDDGGMTVRSIEDQLGRGALGLGVFRALSEAPRAWRSRALIVVGIAAARRIYTPEERENLTGLADAFTKQAKRHRARIGGSK